MEMQKFLEAIRNEIENMKPVMEKDYKELVNLIIVRDVIEARI